jgi:hypothetical protein
MVFLWFGRKLMAASRSGECQSWELWWWWAARGRLRSGSREPGAAAVWTAPGRRDVSGGWASSTVGSWLVIASHGAGASRGAGGRLRVSRAQQPF